MNSLLNWIDDRTGYRQLMHEALNEPIPGGAKWRYVWGSTLSFVFMMQVITGFFLWSAYSPSTLTAWESVYYIQYVMQYGWLVRGLHAFSAQAMVILLAMHFLQVVWDGAYKAPREVNFWLGLVLMQIVMGLALTGYLLPWDQKGYYATRVATTIAGSTPGVGSEVQAMVQGGGFYGHHTLTRFFALHAGVLPALLVAFLGLHIYVFRRHGITTPDPKAPVGTFWPEQVLKDAVACLAVLAVILFFVVWKGTELSAPADPGEEYPARPEWYFLFLFRFLKFEAIAQYGEAFGAIYLPGLAMAIIVLMPLIAKIKGGHVFNIVYTIALILGAGTLTYIAMDEDAKDPEFQAKMHFAERDAHRVVELAQREGIPPQGARELLANDAYTQGPRLFARHCASCHRYDGHDAMGIVKMKSKPNKTDPDVPEPATATDLGQFGTRAWLEAVLTDYHNVFEPIANSVQEVDDSMTAEQKLEVERLNELKKRFVGGDMATWSEDNKASLTDPANAESYNALVEFVVAQSGRPDLEIDDQLAAKGLDVFQSGKLANGSIETCTDCHTMKLRGSDDVVADNAGSGAPTLTGYGGKEWLTAFLKHPADENDFYGEHNLMPGFESTLAETEMGLLVDWMTGNYYRGPNHGTQGHGE